MSKKKYVVESAFKNMDVQKIMQLGVDANGRIVHWTDSIENIEELNSDYINEHFGELQDEAYQRGLEDGKWKAEDGCDGCKYYEDTSLTNPCSECSRGHVDHYKPANGPDRIEVGDEVTVASLTDGPLTVVGKAKVLDADGDQAMCYSLLSAKTGTVFEHDVKDHGMDERETPFKTGRHFDHIDKLLEAMRA